MVNVFCITYHHSTHFTFIQQARKTYIYITFFKFHTAKHIMLMNRSSKSCLKYRKKRPTCGGYVPHAHASVLLFNYLIFTNSFSNNSIPDISRCEFNVVVSILEIINKYMRIYFNIQYVFHENITHQYVH